MLPKTTCSVIKFILTSFPQIVGQAFPQIVRAKAINPVKCQGDSMVTC